ncbi:hypothetical protein DFH09DRAFT_1492531 [Mycena vulgaris]|nr:hypothetical protein DFH09DRAFT_1492531 [Mycena vulgaris]
MSPACSSRESERVRNLRARSRKRYQFKRQMKRKWRGRNDSSVAGRALRHEGPRNPPPPPRPPHPHPLRARSSARTIAPNPDSRRGRHIIGTALYLRQGPEAGRRAPLVAPSRITTHGRIRAHAALDVTKKPAAGREGEGQGAVRYSLYVARHTDELEAVRVPEGRTEYTTYMPRSRLLLPFRLRRASSEGNTTTHSIVQIHDTFNPHWPAQHCPKAGGQLTRKWLFLGCGQRKFTQPLQLSQNSAKWFGTV